MEEWGQFYTTFMCMHASPNHCKDSNKNLERVYLFYTDPGRARRPDEHKSRSRLSYRIQAAAEAAALFVGGRILKWSQTCMCPIQ